MKTRLVIFQIVYYLLGPLLLFGCLFFASLLLRRVDSLGAVIAVTNGFLFLVLPLLTAFFVRLSLLKWYVDPFAALELPLLLYLYMVINKAADFGGLAEGFARINNSLLSNNGEGALFFIGLFLLGLLVSFSVSRKDGENISYRLLRKLGIIS